MAGTDPLTTLPAMIAAIEPGFRLIDGLLLKDLLIMAGQAAAPGPVQNRLFADAAGIEAGMRMVDTELLRFLAVQINAPDLAQDFANAMPGPRLIDGIPWRELAAMTTEEDEPEPPPEPPPETPPEPEPEPC